MEVEIKNGSLFINGEIKISQFFVSKFLLLSNCIIVLIEHLRSAPEGRFDDNILRLDFEGKIEWQIKNFEFDQPHKFTNVWIGDEKELKAYSGVGFEVTIDLLSGKLLKTEFVK